MAAAREGFKIGDRSGEVLRRADRLPRRQQPGAPSDVANHRFFASAEPVVDAGVEDLVCGGIAPVGHDEFPGLRCVGRRGDGFHGG